MSDTETKDQAVGGHVTDISEQTLEETDSGKRLRSLTPKAAEAFEIKFSDFVASIQKCWREIDAQTKDLSSVEKTDETLREFLHELNVKCKAYQKKTSEFIEFLERTRTPSSLAYKDVFVRELQRKDEFMRTTFTTLHSIIRDLKAEKKPSVGTEKQSEFFTFDDIGSVKSYRSVKSRDSTRSDRSNSTTASQSRAKAEALKARVVFARKEADLKRQRASLEIEHERQTASMEIELKRQTASLEIDLEVLNAEKEAAAAVAEANVLNPSSESREDSISSLPIEDATVKTETYVKDLLKNMERDRNVNTVTKDLEPRVTGLNPSALSFVPLNPHASQISAPDVTRLLLKKDLLFASLTPFNDLPESYQAWKQSFKIKMAELSVTPLEEMDLLIKWTGPASKEQVINMRSAFYNDPVRGIDEIWQRLDERFGSPESIENALKKKLHKFPKLSNTDSKKLYELSDILCEIRAVKENPKYSSVLSYFDSSTGVIPVVNKLPHFLQEKWTNSAQRYMERYQVCYPPFTHFCQFIREQSKIRNNPSFQYTCPLANASSFRNNGDNRTKISARKTSTEVAQSSVPTENAESSKDVTEVCPLHNMNHSLLKCHKFKAKPIDVRRKFLYERKLCYRCCSNKHQRHDCKANVQCDDCQSTNHVTVMHFNFKKPVNKQLDADETRVKTACTQICGGKFGGKSCAKVVPVTVYHKSNPGLTLKTYALLDDQSNKTLGSPAFFARFAGHFDFPEVTYSLSSCVGVTETKGRRAEGFVVQTLDGTIKLDLPIITECEHIPDDKEEIPTPEVAYNHVHLHDIANEFSEYDPNCLVTLLIGRDLVEAHHVIDQRIGAKGSPYAQRLSLGWVIIGETCLGRIHRPPSDVSVFKTHLLSNGRPSLLPSCPNELKIKFAPEKPCDFEINDLFGRSDDDEKLGMSIEDVQFMQLMDSELVKDCDGNFTAPLPFRSPRQRLPNNRGQAFKRAKILHASLERNPVKKEHFVTFMQGIIDNGHAEVAPPLNSQEECWYLPLFGVYHPKKKDKIRGVFDSSATYEGVSLNSVLLKGPDLTNSLIGVLMRFRQDSIALCGDIESMFYCFSVSEEHRNFLRFFWHEANDPSKPLIEFRMCKHVFGNRPSPAVANCGLRKAVDNADEDVKRFINRNFYVDDGLVSCEDVDSAISLMKRTQHALHTNANIRLHKIASNSQSVLDSFDSDDIAKDINSIDIDRDDAPLQRSLGLHWDLKHDSFTFNIDFDGKPYTRRGVLATINSLYDPLGFAAPVTIKGRVLLRNMMSTTKDWDESLSEDFKSEWNNWERSLHDLESVKIPRPHHYVEKESVMDQGLHVFCDASENAVAAVAFLKVKDTESNIHVGFVMGKSRVAPKQGHTIPRLELCAALLAVEVAETVSGELDIPPVDIVYYSDSKVVLGYLNNKTRRFFVYVTNRVERILRFSQPHQWRYVSTCHNPADHGTRFVPPSMLEDCSWLKGPQFLRLTESETPDVDFPLIEPQSDKEIRCAKTTALVQEPKPWLTSEKMERFSSLSRLVRAVSVLRTAAINKSSVKPQPKPDNQDVDFCKQSEKFIIREAQSDIYGKEVQCLREGKPLNRDSSLLTLAPVLNEEGLLCVGGRLRKANISVRQKNPILIPGKNYLATLLIRHFHEKVSHQGRHLTEGALREAGYWITGGKRLVSSVIHSCVTCRKLRGKLSFQRMADLPSDRLEPGPPFSSVGVDCFGPWDVVARKTRGGQANSKRWAVLFTCLTSRAVHIEVIEEMSTSSFINALRRFVAIRGKVRVFRSDRGSNFVGSMDKLGGINIENETVRKFLFENDSKWIFNPPHASHMGGVWERLIGVTRRILDSLLLDSRRGTLTHEVLTTFLAEVTAIINSRPLLPLSSDPQDPFPLSPSLILTHKSDSIASVTIPGNVKDMYRAQWKMVQCLADMFWRKWRTEFLQSLQERRKWNRDQRNFQVSDVVLLRDKQSIRNYWPMGVVDTIVQSDDGNVRTVDVRVISPKGTSTVYTRPINELVLLVAADHVA